MCRGRKRENGFLPHHIPETYNSHLISSFSLAREKRRKKKDEKKAQEAGRGMRALFSPQKTFSQLLSLYSSLMLQKDDGSQQQHHSVTAKARGERERDTSLLSDSILASDYFVQHMLSLCVCHVAPSSHSVLSGSDSHDTCLQKTKGSSIHVVKDWGRNGKTLISVTMSRMNDKPRIGSSSRRGKEEFWQSLGKRIYTRSKKNRLVYERERTGEMMKGFSRNIHVLHSMFTQIMGEEGRKCISISHSLSSPWSLVQSVVTHRFSPTHNTHTYRTWWRKYETRHAVMEWN